MYNEAGEWPEASRALETRVHSFIYSFMYQTVINAHVRGPWLPSCTSLFAPAAPPFKYIACDHCHAPHPLPPGTLALHGSQSASLTYLGGPTNPGPIEVVFTIFPYISLCIHVIKASAIPGGGALVPYGINWLHTRANLPTEEFPEC